MPINRLTLNELRANDIPHTISYENRSSHAALLRRASHIRHTQRDDQTNNRTKRANDTVSRNGTRRAPRPLTTPDHGASCYDGQAADNQHDYTYVRDFEAQPACQKDKHEADPT